ncbi:MAG: hypothetical protein LBU22_05760 [Dysgonamonadaceae bacterium]|jgi:hypothetical protein|nr:hypothetical protein [Dysgonamonadaceae bacterium]
MTKDYRHIEELTGRFFDGLTSNSEECELYDFFSGEDIPEYLRPYKAVFTFFKNGIHAETTPNRPETGKKPAIKSGKKTWALWWGIAASLLVVISLRFFRPDQETLYEGSYILKNGVKIIDPEIVRAEIEKIRYTVMLQEIEYEQLTLDADEAELQLLQLSTEEMIGEE